MCVVYDNVFLVQTALKITTLTITPFIFQLAFMQACTDCNFLASSPEALEEHFQQQPSPPSPEVQGQATNSTAKPSDSLTCDMCHLTLYNQCSFMAHMRMHKRISPHTCPECGQTFDG